MKYHDLYHISRITYHVSLYGCCYCGLNIFFGSQYVHAAALTDLMIRVSTPIVESFSDYTIMFRSASGMASGSISLNLTNASMNLTALTRDDLDLMFGATQATIATTAGAGVWGRGDRHECTNHYVFLSDNRRDTDSGGGAWW